MNLSDFDPSINWEGELEKYKKPFLEYMEKCLTEKDEALQKQGVNYAYKAAVNGMCSGIVVINWLKEKQKLDLERDAIIKITVRLVVIFTAMILEILLLKIRNEKEETKKLEIQELEKLFK